MKEMGGAFVFCFFFSDFYRDTIFLFDFCVNFEGVITLNNFSKQKVCGRQLASSRPPAATTSTSIAMQLRSVMFFLTTTTGVTS